jgi:hypothetical protein
MSIPAAALEIGDGRLQKATHVFPGRIMDSEPRGRREAFLANFAPRATA